MRRACTGHPWRLPMRLSAALLAMLALAVPALVGAAEPGRAQAADPPGAGSDPKPAASEELVECIGEGWGASMKEARSEALAAALMTRVKALLTNVEEVRDFELSTVLRTHTRAFIESATLVGEPELRNNLVFVRYRVKIRVGEVRSALVREGFGPVLVDMPTAVARMRQLEENAKQGASLAADLFRNFPACVLDARVVEGGPRLVSESPDGSHCTFEVRVRVEVDDRRWQTWFGEACEVLGHVALESGDEAWNLRQKGWIPLDDVVPRDPDSGAAGQLRRAAVFRRIPLLLESVPEAARGLGELYITDRLGNWLGRPIRQPACFAKEHVLAVFDPTSGRLRWWRFDAKAWDAVNAAIRTPPHLRLRLTDGFGAEQGEPVRDWLAGADGRPLARQFIGHPQLRVQVGEGADVRFSVSWRMGPRTGREGRCRLIVPAADFELTCSEGSGFAFSPVTVFPFRFRLDCEEVLKLKRSLRADPIWTTP